MRSFRAFLAVPLGDEIVRAAADLSVRVRERLRSQGAEAKWVPPTNMHVTLRFLGNIEEAQVPDMKEALAPVTRRHASFFVRIGALGAFPSPSRPSVLWVGLLDGAEALTNLAVDVGQAISALGFPEEDRPFHPHLTLARFRRGPGIDVSDLVTEHAGFEVGSTVIRDVLLFESVLRNRGPVYHPIWRGALNPGGAPPRAGTSTSALPPGAGGEKER